MILDQQKNNTNGDQTPQRSHLELWPSLVVTTSTRSLGFPMELSLLFLCWLIYQLREIFLSIKSNYLIQEVSNILNVSVFSRVFPPGYRWIFLIRPLLKKFTLVHPVTSSLLYCLGFPTRTSQLTLPSSATITTSRLSQLITTDIITSFNGTLWKSRERKITE